MKKQVYNPYLPLNEYVPDGEPRVFGERVYIYGSHDKEGGDKYCMLDYVCYSASVSDLKNWRYEGEIYKRSQDPHDTTNQYMWAPDVCQGPDGRYYLYYVLSNELEIAVAVCDTPAGKYEYYGRVHYADGRLLEENIPFDPGLLNDDGRIYLYYGFAPSFPMERMAGRKMPGASVVELEADMLTVKTAPKVVLPSRKYAAGTAFEGHAFFEACSIRKIEDLYYLIYASELVHELCYAYSSYPDKEFRYGGTVISNADIGYQGRKKEEALNCLSNNHGGLAEALGKWYIFYHRHTHGTQFSRQGCAEPVERPENGVIKQAEITSCGLNGGPLEGRGEYSAALACNLYGKERGVPIPFVGGLKGQPYIVAEDGNHLITGMEDGAVAGFKYFTFDGTAGITLRIRGSAGRVELSNGRTCIGTAGISESAEFREYAVEIAPLHGVFPLYVSYFGEGKIDFLSIRFD